MLPSELCLVPTHVAMWEFVPETTEESVSAPVGTVEYRPDRMGLGCSKEIIQEKISENAKKSRLIKLLKRKGEVIDDGFVASRETFKCRDADEEESKSKIVKKREVVNVSNPPVVKSDNVTKNQKKRLRKKQNEIQKKISN